MQTIISYFVSHVTSLRSYAEDEKSNVHSASSRLGPPSLRPVEILLCPQ